MLTTNQEKSAQYRLKTRFSKLHITQSIMFIKSDVCYFLFAWNSCKINFTTIGGFIDFSLHICIVLLERMHLFD